MGSAELVSEKIEAGSSLLRQLDRDGIRVGSAFWLYDRDADDWRLILSMPLVDERGLRPAYDHLADALQAAGVRNLYLRDIAAVGVDDKIVGLLRSTIRTGSEVGSVRFAAGGVDHALVENPYVYRST